MTPRCPAARLVRISLPATLEAMEKFLLDLGLRAGWFAAGADCFATELLLREVLTNAVVHGSHRDPMRRVHCSVRLRGGRFTFAVRDEGCGFDWRAGLSRVAQPSDASGRGMEILQQYATGFRFSSLGNAVVVWRDTGMEPAR